MSAIAWLLSVTRIYVEALNNLSSVLAQQGKIDDAIATLQEAVRVAPDHLASHNNLGNLYRLQDRLEEAARSYREVLHRKAAGAVDSLRISTLCPTIFSGHAEMQEYYAGAEAEWTHLNGAASYSDLSDLLMSANEPPYNLQFSASNILSIKQAYARIFRYEGPVYELAAPASRIRIGFVVTSHHEIAFLRLIWGALKRMDSDRFELTILCTSRAAKSFRNSVQDPNVSVLGLPERPDQVIGTILSARFDVLYYFEIGTDSYNYFLPFFRLAPVQCTSWGIQVTSGIPQVDYYLSSKLVEPPDGDEHYSEQMLRAETLLSYQTAIEPPDSPRSRESFGFSAGQNIYMCAQHLGKFHLDFDGLVGGVLREDPAGTFVMTTDRYGHGARKLAERLRRTIPDVADRVIQLLQAGLARLSQLDHVCRRLA